MKSLQCGQREIIMPSKLPLLFQICLFAISTVLIQPLSSAFGQTAPVQIRVDSTTLTVGETDDIDIVLQSGSQLIGAATLFFTYDPAIITITDCQQKQFIGSCNIQPPGKISIGGISPSGSAGDITFATVTVVGKNAGDAKIALTQPVTLSDEAAANLSFTASVGTVSVDALDTTQGADQTNNCEIALNGGFENGLADWTEQGDPSAPPATLLSDSIIGNSSLSIANGRVLQVLPASPGDTFTFSGQYKLTGYPLWVGAGIDYLDANDIEVGKSLVRIPPTADIGVFSLPSTAPAGATQIRLWLHTSSNQTPFIVDEVSLIHDNC